MIDYKLMPVEPTQEMLDNATRVVTDFSGGFDGFNDYLDEGTARAVYAAFRADAPVVQGEPVAAQHRFRHPQVTPRDWSSWQPASISLDRPSWEIDSQGYEVEYRLLYTTAQPTEQQSSAGDVPEITATFECESNGVTGSTAAPIKRVELHDDGSFEVILDCWPTSSPQGAVVSVNLFDGSQGRELPQDDYSQIELRTMAHLSGDKELLNALEEGLDVHKATATEVFGVTPENVTDDMRRSAKATNFGLIYGMTAFDLAKQGQHSKLTPDVLALVEALEHITNMDSMSYHSLESAKIVARKALATCRKEKES